MEKKKMYTKLLAKEKKCLQKKMSIFTVMHYTHKPNIVYIFKMLKINLALLPSVIDVSIK